MQNVDLTVNKHLPICAEETFKCLTAVEKVAVSIHELMHTECQLTLQVNSAAAEYSAAIQCGKVSKAAEELRLKWYKLIDQRRDVQLAIKEAEQSALEMVKGLAK